MNLFAQRLEKIRAAMLARGLDAWIIPTEDPHLSEYVPSCWRFRAWASGFTGSAGTLCITRTQALLWTDSRYWLQASRQLEQTGIVLMKDGQAGTPCLPDWLAGNLPANSVLGIDARRTSLKTFGTLEAAAGRGHFRISTGFCLETEVWTDAPSLPAEPIREFAFEAGKRRERLELIRSAMRSSGCSAMLLSSLSDIAWTLALRGSDVPYNPVFIAYLLVDERGAVLFVGPGKIDADLAGRLARDGVRTAGYGTVFAHLAGIHLPVAIDPRQTSLAIRQALADPREADNPTVLAKAIKTPEQIQQIRLAMERDGAALAQFWSRFEDNLAAGVPMSELDVVRGLHECRSRQPGYVSESFGTIAGFGPNGAVVHYEPTADSFSPIGTGSFLLVDSGAQYESGTTDITRVVPVGDVPQEARRDYTLVLRGTIGLGRAKFPAGTNGLQLDVLARAPMWQSAGNFFHGTGHGVGFFLNVHEGPQRISSSAAPGTLMALRPGMVTSDEPGLYRSGQWGVRIENLVLAVPSADEGFLEFETLTLCPIDTRPILPGLLQPEEIDWLNSYHRMVWERVSPLLQGRPLQWLRERTNPLAA